jgi:hypothetical protein
VWRLNLAGNALARVPTSALSQLVSLQILDLSSNHIAEVERGTFEACCPALTAIRLDSNQLTGMGQLFHQATSADFDVFFVHTVRDK